MGLDDFSFALDNGFHENVSFLDESAAIDGADFIPWPPGIFDLFGDDLEAEPTPIPALQPSEATISSHHAPLPEVVPPSIVLKDMSAITNDIHSTNKGVAAKGSDLNGTHPKDFKREICLRACWRCKILKKKVNSRQDIFMPSTDMRKCDQESPCKNCPRHDPTSKHDHWKVLGCHRGELKGLPCFKKSESLHHQLLFGRKPDMARK